MSVRINKAVQTAALRTPAGLDPEAVRKISGALNILLADIFALYLKTKNFHWHLSGSHFRDYHLPLGEQAGQIFATTDDIAERAANASGCRGQSTTKRVTAYLIAAIRSECLCVRCTIFPSHGHSSPSWWACSSLSSSSSRSMCCALSIRALAS